MDSASNIPLCVDLDGTLVKTDMLFECALRLIKKNPIYIIYLFLWLARGKAELKREVVSRIELDSSMFPFNDEILDYVRSESNRRKTVLVTGSDQKIADFVASETRVFDLAQGSDGKENLTANNKRDWLVREFGKGNFDYIGNDTDDIAVWADARDALLAGSEADKESFGATKFVKIFPVAKPKVRDFLSLIRMHQWLKNMLIFIPFLLDKTIQSWPNLFIVVLSFFTVSLLASMTYIVNDMLDLSADRANETKKKRALASCRIPLETGVVSGGVLFLLVCFLALFLPTGFNWILVLYLAFTLYYSFYLKRRMILDVCAIAGLHTIRIIAGVLAVGAIWSFWLLAFSMFVFFSLALAKRVSELTNLKNSGRSTAEGRAYRVGDLPMLSTIGVSTGYISVLVVALFVNSEKVMQNYSQPMLLWLLCPLLMYWIGRLWIITARGDLHEDPIVFAVKDKLSFAVVIALAVVVAAASLL